METDKTGSINITGIPPSAYSYSLSWSMPAGGYVPETVMVNGVDLKTSYNPMLVAFVAEPSNFNQSLNINIAPGIVFFTGYNILYVDPSKASSVNIMFVINDTYASPGHWSCGSNGTCQPNGTLYGNGTCENACLPTTTSGESDYFTFVYPNGGAYMTPAGGPGTPLTNILCGPSRWNPAPGGSSTAVIPPQSPCTPTSSNLVSCTPSTCTASSSLDCSGNGTQVCTCNVVGGSGTYISNYACTGASTTCSDPTLTCVNGKCVNPSLSPTVTTAPTVTSGPTSIPTSTPTLPPGVSPTTVPTSGGSYSFTISGTVYVDTNGNGTQDSGEPGYGPTAVSIASENGAGTAAGGTNTSGYYSFNITNHPAGNDNYSVILTVPQGYKATTANPDIINVTGAGSYTANFGIQSTSGISPTATPTIPAGSTVFKFVVGLDGIGTTGDNVTPNNSSGSNKNPDHPTRNLTVDVYNSSNQLVTQPSGATMAYDSNSSSPTYGKFLATVNMGNLASGSYTVKIKSDGYLTRLIPGIQNITAGQTTTMPSVNLVAGDINGDNAINILDYNILTSCSIYSTDNHQLCNTNNAMTISDFDDDGTVDQLDYNLFLREYSVQYGQ